MRGGRVLIIVGFIVLLGAAVVGFLLLRGGGQQPAPPAEVGEGTAEAFIPPGMVKIVVSAQNIPRGTRITSDAVQMKDWPEDSLPDGHLTNVDDALDRVARMDIALDSPVTDNMLTSKEDDVASQGSDAALQIPSGKVAYALAVAGNASVAWAIQPGDHVDVLISIMIVDIDEEFQTLMPNNAECVDPPEGEQCQGGIYGRIEVLPTGAVVNVVPRNPNEQFPRMVTQLTVQDAIVLRVGPWTGDAPVPVEEAEEGEAQPARRLMRWVTLATTPQDALVLKYAEEAGTSMDFVLRSAADRDRGLVTTEAVTLQYVMDRFGMEVPPTLPYAVTMPPAVGVRLGAAGEVAYEITDLVEYSRWHWVFRDEIGGVAGEQ